MTLPGQSDEQPTVLVVDDERATADLYTKYLEGTYRVRTAYSGTEALDLMDSTVDVVLLDRKMPRPSGDEVLEEIRARGDDCRIVMTTGVTPDVDIIELPFDEYLLKPISSETVHDAVERMLVRTTYDAGIREAMSLASKMATLESKLELDDLAACEAYTALEARFLDLREELGEVELLDDPYPEFTIGKIRTVVG